MSFQIKKASRQQVKLKLGLSAVSGAGKTYSALLLAKGLTGGDLSKVCLIDTENGSGSLYSHLGDYSTISLDAPFTPQRYVQAIVEAVKSKQFEVLIIDSVSHEWDGKGGCLEIYENLGGRFTDWAKVTPMHRQFIDAILQSPLHVITTARRKQDYAVEQNEKGKATPKKVGLKEVQREGFEYELTVNFDIEINHMALASKDRTGIFSTKVPFMISEDTGKMIKEWNESGAVVATTEKEAAVSSPPVDDLDAALNSAPADGIPMFDSNEPIPFGGPVNEGSAKKTEPPATKKNEAPISAAEQKNLFALAEHKGIKPTVIKTVLEKEYGIKESKMLKKWQYEEITDRMIQGGFQ